MAKRASIEIQGLTIHLEKIRDDDFVSLTDIAKQSTKEPRFLIMSWLKNRSTLEFLETWEQLHNPLFKRDQMRTFKDEFLQNRHVLTPQKWIETTGAIGLISKSGRYQSGTFGHKDIALNFCYWLSPAFQVFMIKEFQRLKEEEFSRRSLEWHLSKITNSIDDIRNLLDTIPGQLPELNRLHQKD